MGGGAALFLLGAGLVVSLDTAQEAAVDVLALDSGSLTDNTLMVIIVGACAQEVVIELKSIVNVL